MFHPPRIGMPCRLDLGSDRLYLSRDYSDAVSAAGGVPVIFPLLDKPEALRGLVRELDGILLTGSNSDVDPARYGSSKRAVCGPVQPLRDAMDFELLETVMKEGKPLLAICFGVQSLNVFLGGTLIQDIASAIETSIRHDNPETQGDPCHSVEIVAGSPLERLAGARVAEVNSTHHQALDRLGAGLRVEARAPDGIIESVTCPSHPAFLLGVQWHPEKNSSRDRFSGAIFESFLQACGKPAGVS